MDSTEQRFWDKVLKTDTCWFWVASKTYGMYGSFKVNGKSMGAHRFSWQIKNGQIPKGLQVLHKCDNPPCVNPNHLFLGTQKDNMDDMINKKRDIKPKGEQHGRAKLSEEDIAYIRSYPNYRGSQKELAKKFKVSKDRINSIIHRKTWRHIC